MNQRTGARVVAAIGATLLLVGSCDNSPATRSETVTTNAPQAEKRGTGEKRSELEPLLKRFVALGSPQSATWYSGTLGDDRVPGPSSYWIDAVVTLEANTAKDLILSYAAEPTETEPQTVPELRDAVPSGELVRSPQLDRAFSTDLGTQVWIEPDSGQLILTAKGQ